MSNAVKQNSLNYVAWSVTVDSSDETSDLVSDSFTFQDKICKLKLSERRFLSLEYADVMIYPVNILLLIFESSNTYRHILVNIYGRTRNIWRSSNSEKLDGLVTFIFIVRSDPLSRLKPVHELCVSHQSKPTSYLVNNAHFYAFSRDLSKLLDNASSYDVIITCQGNTLLAHKIVLGARCAVLLNMYKSNKTKGDIMKITVKGIDHFIFKHFLRYLYTGILPELCMETAKQLHKVAELYRVDEIKIACLEFMTNNLSESNACEILVLVSHLTEKKLHKKVVSYIVDTKIPKCDKNWPDFCEKHSCLANEILNAYIEKHCTD